LIDCVIESGKEAIACTCFLSRLRVNFSNSSSS